MIRQDSVFEFVRRRPCRAWPPKAAPRGWRSESALSRPGRRTRRAVRSKDRLGQIGALKVAFVKTARRRRCSGDVSGSWASGILARSWRRQVGTIEDRPGPIMLNSPLKSASLPREPSGRLFRSSPWPPGPCRSRHRRAPPPESSLPQRAENPRAAASVQTSLSRFDLEKSALAVARWVGARRDPAVHHVRGQVSSTWRCEDGASRPHRQDSR